MKDILNVKKQTKALQVTFIHTIYTKKHTSSNFYPYNIHKQKHFKVTSIHTIYINKST